MLLPNILLLFVTFPLLLLQPVSASSSSQQQQQQRQLAPSFSDNCAEINFKEVVCSVTKVNCEADTDFITKANSARLLPDEVHDLRIETLSKTTTRNKSPGDGNGSHDHRLSVEMSWQTPPNNSTRFLKAFLIEIDGENGRKHECFLFNVTGSNWTKEVITHSPRFQFSSDSIFKFSHNYAVTVYSLPESEHKSNSVQRSFHAPHNPSATNFSDFVSANCSRFSHPYASKWTAGFRHIFIHSVARKMQVEFVGAPPQYCFEQYEVRLLDETGDELLYSGIVGVDEMRKEVTANNVTITYGVFNFTVEYDRVYIPSVIPMEKAADGRCLCPVHGSDPYDIKVVCSCVAADWKPVRINRLDVVQPIEDTPPLPPLPVANNVNGPQRSEEGTKIWVWFLLLNLVLGVFIFAAVLYLLGYCHRLIRPNKSQQHVRRIRFFKPNGDAENLVNGELKNGGQQVTASLPTSILLDPQLNVLIAYSHDSPAHEEAVQALAEYLRDVYNLQITLDCWDTARIQTNLVDYVAASVLDADRVILVNSLGSHDRYIAKVMHRGYAVERDQPGIYDKIFLQQIDMVITHPNVISTRFDYSSHLDTIPQFADSLNYSIPDNMAALMSAIFRRNMKQDGRLVGYSPQLVKLEAKVKQAMAYCTSTPRWFAATHHRRLHEEAAKPEMELAATTTTSLVPTTTTIETVNETVEEPAEQPTGQKELSAAAASPAMKLKADETEEPSHDSGIELTMASYSASAGPSTNNTTNMETCSSDAEESGSSATEETETPLTNGHLVEEAAVSVEGLATTTTSPVQQPDDSCVVELSTAMSTTYEDDSGYMGSQEQHKPNGVLPNGYLPMEKLVPKMGRAAVAKQQKETSCSNNNRRKKRQNGGTGGKCHETKGLCANGTIENDDYPVIS